ncbi:unnamed protein product, partial [Polarella glacialis]
DRHSRAGGPRSRGNEFDEEEENGQGSRGGGLLDGLDQNTLFLLCAGVGYACWKGIIPIHQLDFWQIMMLWNLVQPILIGGRRRGSNAMGSFGGGFGGVGMGHGGFGGMGRGFGGFGRGGFR